MPGPTSLPSSYEYKPLPMEQGLRVRESLQQKYDDTLGNIHENKLLSEQAFQDLPFDNKTGAKLREKYQARYDAAIDALGDDQRGIGSAMEVIRKTQEEMVMGPVESYYTKLATPEMQNYLMKWKAENPNGYSPFGTDNVEELVAMGVPVGEYISARAGTPNILKDVHEFFQMAPDIEALVYNYQNSGLDLEMTTNMFHDKAIAEQVDKLTPNQLGTRAYNAFQNWLAQATDNPNTNAQKTWSLKSKYEGVNGAEGYARDFLSVVGNITRSTSEYKKGVFSNTSEGNQNKDDVIVIQGDGPTTLTTSPGVTIADRNKEVQELTSEGKHAQANIVKLDIEERLKKEEQLNNYLNNRPEIQQVLEETGTNKEDLQKAVQYLLEETESPISSMARNAAMDLFNAAATTSPHVKFLRSQMLKLGDALNDPTSSLSVFKKIYEEINSAMAENPQTMSKWGAKFGEIVLLTADGLELFVNEMNAKQNADLFRDKIDARQLQEIVDITRGSGSITSSRQYGLAQRDGKSLPMDSWEVALTMAGSTLRSITAVGSSSRMERAPLTTEDNALIAGILSKKALHSKDMAVEVGPSGSYINIGIPNSDIVDLFEKGKITSEEDSPLPGMLEKAKENVGGISTLSFALDVNSPFYNLLPEQLKQVVQMNNIDLPAQMEITDGVLEEGMKINEGITRHIQELNRMGMDLIPSATLRNKAIALDTEGILVKRGSMPADTKLGYEVNIEGKAESFDTVLSKVYSKADSLLLQNIIDNIAMDLPADERAKAQVLLDQYSNFELNEDSYGMSETKQTLKELINNSKVTKGKTFKFDNQGVISLYLSNYFDQGTANVDFSGAGIKAAKAQIDGIEFQPLIELIHQVEADEGYGSIWKGTTANYSNSEFIKQMKEDNKILEDYSLQELTGMKEKGWNGAKGFLQIMPDTLGTVKNNMAIRKQVGLDGDWSEIQFDQETQAKLFLALIKIQGKLDQYVEDGDEDAFLKRLSTIWAGLPKDETNLSFYDGVGENKAGVPYKAVKEALRKITGKEQF